MTQISLTFDTEKARERRDRGIQAAVDHANAETRDWETMAYEFFVNVFLRHQKGPFMCEDYRAACKGVVPDPPSLRAFGGIITKAKKRGLIKRIGTRAVKNSKANCAFATVWHKM